MVSLPNFVVIGASRSGTTSLHHYLGQHPDIYVSPRKSPNYFVAPDPQPPRENATLQAMAKQWISTQKAYEAEFRGVTDERAVGDISPVYLQSIHAAKRIKDTLAPSTKFIAILRNPVDRAYAHYLGRRRDGLEPVEDFNAIVERELAGPVNDDIAFGSYIGCGKYHHFLKPFYEQFPADNIRVYLFDQLQEDLPGLLRDLFLFLGVDPNHQVDTTLSHNQTGIIANPLLRTLWTRSVGVRTKMRPYLPAFIRHTSRSILAKQVSKPSLGTDVRQKISSALREDTQQLQQLIGRDLSNWLSADLHLNAQG
jgi:hypothetical protein